MARKAFGAAVWLWGFGTQVEDDGGMGVVVIMMAMELGDFEVEDDCCARAAVGSLDWHGAQLRS